MSESMVEKVCGGCEYFDRHFGDCHGPRSPRFQTEADSAACPSFYPDTTAALSNTEAREEYE